MKALRFLVALILFLGFTASLKAQLVNYRNEKIFVNNQLYGYLIKKGSVWAKDYSFQSTKNEEIATIKAINKEMTNGHDYVYYVVSFKGYTQKGEMDLIDGFDRQLASEMGVYNILKNDVLNPEGVERFLAHYPATISKRLDGKLIKNEPTASVAAPTPVIEVAQKPAEVPVKAEVKPEVKVEVAPVSETAKVAPKPEPTVVVVAVPVPMSAYANPDSKPNPAPTAAPAVAAPVAVVAPEPVIVPAKTSIPSVPGLKIAGTSILKGKKKVGRFAVNEQAVNNNLKKSYGFYNAKNLKIASATFPNAESTACKIYTPKDKKTRTVNIANNGEALKALSGWLVQNRYL